MCECEPKTGKILAMIAKRKEQELKLAQIEEAFRLNKIAMDFNKNYVSTGLDWKVSLP